MKRITFLVIIITLLIPFPVWWVRVQIFFEHGPSLAVLATMILLAVSLLALRKPHKGAIKHD